MPRSLISASSVACLLLLLPSSSQLASAVILKGRATGAGPLANCKVTLSGGPHKASTVTDDQGYFELDVAGASSLAPLAGSLLRLDREGSSSDGDGGGEGSACVDTAVGLAPPISLGALVPIYDKETPSFAAINGITTLAYYTKKNVQTPQVSPYTKLFGGPDFDAATFYSSFGTTLGIGEASRGGTADILLLSTQSRSGEPGSAPEKDAVKAQAFSLQVLTSLAVGGKGLAGLKPGVSPDAAAEAMVVATFPAGAGVMKTGTKFELSRPGSLAAIFNKALGGAPQDVVESVSRSLAWLNEAASREVTRAVPVEAADAPSSSSTTPEEALTGGARALKVAQATLGPAAGDVAADGADGLDAFEASYGSKALIDGLVESADVPGVKKTSKLAKGAAATATSSSSKSGSGSSKNGKAGAEVASFAATKTRKMLAVA